MLMESQKPQIICPKCRTELNESRAYCPVCGAQMQPASTGKILLLVGSILLFVVVGLPTMCLGGCFLLMSSGVGKGAGETIMYGLGFLAAFGVTLALLIYQIARWKK